MEEYLTWMWSGEAEENLTWLIVSMEEYLTWMWSGYIGEYLTWMCSGDVEEYLNLVELEHGRISNLDV